MIKSIIKHYDYQKKLSNQNPRGTAIRLALLRKGETRQMLQTSMEKTRLSEIRNQLQHLPALYENGCGRTARASEKAGSEKHVLAHAKYLICRQDTNYFS